MQRTFTTTTALAAVMAAAGGLLAPAAAQAQTRPYAGTGAYDEVQQTSVAPGQTVDNGGGSDYHGDMSQTSIQAGGIHPDDPRSPDPDGVTSQDNALAAASTDQARIQNAKSARRRPSIFDHTTPDERHFVVAPYIEAGQVVDATLSPTSDVTTYSVFAAGIDAAIEGRNNQGTLALRIERRQGWGKAGSDWAVSGIGRASSSIIQDALRIDVAGYADKTRIDGSGAVLPGVGTSDSVAQTYTIVGGPSFSTDLGQVKLDGHYHIGYSSVGTPGALTVGGGAVAADVFSHSTVHDANLRASVRPGDVLPVGLALEQGFYQENISNLDQLARDWHVRGEVTVPIGDGLALVGGIGYERVLVAGRDAQRAPGTGAPLLDSSGRILADYSKPRQIALDTQGLIWDAGVTWRPSPRTDFEAHVGRRYGQFGGYGKFTYHPTGRQTLNLLVYNNLSGFGGQVTNSLFNLPTQFSVYRDGLTGNISPCVGSNSGGDCLSGSLGSVRSTVYRSRGITAAYSLDLGHIQTGLGAGYDRRTYVAAPGTVVASLDGKTDNYYWVATFVTAELSPHSSLNTTLDAYWFQSGVALNSDVATVRATSVYNYAFSRHLSASAAVSVEGVNRQALEDVWGASGKVGVRYTF